MSDISFTLDLGENSIKAADVSIINNKIEAKSLGYIELDFPFFSTDTPTALAKTAEIIKKLINSCKINKKNVDLVVPDVITYSQIVEMPDLKEKELISAIKYQADQFIPMPIEQTNIDLEIIWKNEKEKKLLVLIVAAPKKIVEKIQAVAETAGLIPQSLENQLSATSRFLSQFLPMLLPQSNEGTLIINLGLTSTSFYFFNPKLSLISQIHSFNLGYNLFVKEIQINTNLDQKKVTEILKSYNLKETSSISIENIITPITKEFLFELKKIEAVIWEKHQLPVKNILLIGEIYRFPVFSQLIEKNFTRPTSILNPYPLFHPKPIVDQYKNDLPFFIPALGGNIQ